jgi:hypothetical protein
VCPQSGSGILKEGKILLLSGIELRFDDRVARSVVTVPTHMSQLLSIIKEMCTYVVKYHQSLITQSSVVATMTWSCQPFFWIKIEQ